MSQAESVSPIKYSNGIVAFIDVLGWKDAVTRSESDQGLLSRLSTVLRRVKTRADEMVLGKGYSSGARVHQFSDAQFLTVTDGEDTRIGPEYVTLWCRLMAREYLKEGFLIRGAITVGRLLDDEWSCFGPAVTRAFLLERAVGDPIILVDPETRVQEYFQDPDQYGAVTLGHDGSEEPITMSPLAKTRDGRLFVDYLRADVSSNVRFRPHDVFGTSELPDLVNMIRNGNYPLEARPKVEWFLQYAEESWRCESDAPISQICFEPRYGARRRVSISEVVTVSAQDQATHRPGN